MLVEWDQVKEDLARKDARIAELESYFGVMGKYLAFREDGISACEVESLCKELQGVWKTISA